jgi:hypothetical protein
MAITNERTTPKTNLRTTLRGMVLAKGTRANPIPPTGSALKHLIQTRAETMVKIERKGNMKDVKKRMSPEAIMVVLTDDAKKNQLANIVRMIMNVPNVAKKNQLPNIVQTITSAANVAKKNQIASIVQTITSVPNVAKKSQLANIVQMITNVAKKNQPANIVQTITSAANVTKGRGILTRKVLVDMDAKQSRHMVKTKDDLPIEVNPSMGPVVKIVESNPVTRSRERGLVARRLVINRNMGMKAKNMVSLGTMMRLLVRND